MCASERAKETIERSPVEYSLLIIPSASTYATLGCCVYMFCESMIWNVCSSIRALSNDNNDDDDTSTIAV